MENSFYQLGVAALLPAAATFLFCFINKYCHFDKIPYMARQVIYGVVFGALAVIGTEWGIPMNGAQVNCRDAAVLCAGLFFGSPAGIIAGLIGGIERWIAVAWGIGTFTRVACSVSTIIAGFYAAFLRKVFFDNKRPGWLLAGSVGIVMEVFHLTMVFLTNMHEVERAMAVVKACSAPMIIANGLSVMISGMILALFLRESIGFKRSHIRISETVQRWMLIAVLIAFALTSLFMFRLQSELANADVEDELNMALEDVKLQLDSGAMEYKVIKAMGERHVGKTGYMIFFDEDGWILFGNERFEFTHVDSLIQALTETKADYTNGKTFRCSNKGVPCVGKYLNFHGYEIFAFLPLEEAEQARNVAMYVNTFLEILVFALLFGLIYLLIKTVVVDKMNKINKSLNRISEGDLTEVIDVRSNEEFDILSNDINTTVDTLKRYIAEAAARLDAELQVATNIQSSVLPRKFPAFPNRKDFDIFASMRPAKEVGGDFYDFYLTDGDNLNFIVADVSGKGIPGAMFMMRAKTELKSLSESGCSIDDTFTTGNAVLCEGNDAGMFVTAWQGRLDLKTGLVKFANAGHNPPLVKHGNGSFEYLKAKVNLVLAGMDGVSYKLQELQLEPGDIIFLYTDGVTEATDAHNELYGEDRLYKILNSREYADVNEICAAVRADVDAFVGEAPQFDDITMLALKYFGA